MKNAAVDLRRAERHEAAAVADVWLQSRRASIPAIPRPTHSDEEVRAWFQTEVLPNQEVWVALAGEAIVALLVLDEDWVEQLYVSPAWMAEGIGSSLLDLAKALRPDGLQLKTFQSNAGAQRFYERHGFVAREVSAENEEGAPDIRYEWHSASAGHPPGI